MNKWIMTLNLSRDKNTTFLEQLTTFNIGTHIELSKTVNAQNLDRIQTGDLVYCRYGGSESGATNNVVRGLYAVLERIGYKESEQLVVFEIKQRYGLKVDTISNEPFFTTLLPHNMIDEVTRKNLKGKLANTGKNSISIENDPQFVAQFLDALNKVRNEMMIKLNLELK
ncbi:MAG: hypothetical protein ACRC0X_06615 [Brevinema sp.]